jgi:hypothetical protein
MCEKHNIPKSDQHILADQIVHLFFEVAYGLRAYYDKSISLSNVIK